MKIIPVLVTLICLYSCRTNEKDTLENFNALKVNVKNNYIKNKAIFSEIKPCLKLKQIRVIEFKKENYVSIEYRLNETSQWQKTEGFINTQVINSLLLREGLSEAFLLELQDKFKVINANRIWILDLFNRLDGTISHGMEIRYVTEVNDLHFFYKVFEKPLGLIPREFYSLQIIDSIGGILDDDVIYYYK